MMIDHPAKGILRPRSNNDIEADEEQKSRLIVEARLLRDQREYAAATDKHGSGLIRQKLCARIQCGQPVGTGGQLLSGSGVVRPNAGPYRFATGFAHACAPGQPARCLRRINGRK